MPKLVSISMIVVIGLVLTMAVLFFYFRSVASYPKYEHGKLVIETPAGKVLMNDIYDLEISKVHETETVIFSFNNQAVMTFNPLLNEFVIIVKDPADRENIEQNFLTLTGLSSTEACKLQVVVGVPYAIQPTVRKSFDLSFCE